MTRLLILVICVLSSLTLLAAGDRSGVWLALASCIEALSIWILSLKRGMGGRDTLDFVCLGICAAGIVLWLVSGQSLLGLSMSIVADLVACVPSLRKTWRLPHTESAGFFALGTLAGICVALAGPYTARAQIYPLYIAGINAVFVWCILWPRPLAAENPTDTPVE